MLGLKLANNRLSVSFVKNISNNYPIILENHFGRVQIRKKDCLNLANFEMPLYA